MKPSIMLALLLSAIAIPDAMANEISANFYGECQFVCVVDADNEIAEMDESPITNEWRFNATIHRAGDIF